MGKVLKIFGIGKKKKPAEAAPPPPVPVVEKPTAMVDDEALANAAKMTLKKRAAARGRASTVLTDRSSDRLGGGL